MSARGLLQNPAMYEGYGSTPLNCVNDWVSCHNLYSTILPRRCQKIGLKGIVLTMGCLMKTSQLFTKLLMNELQKG